MKWHRKVHRTVRWLPRVFVLAAIELLQATSARAADPAAAQPPPATTQPPPMAATEPPAAPPAPAATTPPAMPPPPPAETPAAQAATPPLATEAMPATREEKLPAIDVGAWVRAAGRLQGSKPEGHDLDSVALDTAYAELHAGGKIHKNVSLTLNLNANGLAGTAGIMDAIIGFDFADPIHLWIGQLLVPVDRANFAGPFFMIPWNYPGFMTVGATTVVAAPAEGPAGRNTGGSIWGNDPNGKVKYAVGVFVPPSSSGTPLISGRISTALIGKETGYFGNETFFGDQDIVTIGIGGQYKKDGSVGKAGMTAGPAPTVVPAPTDDYAEFNADALGEFKYGGGGWVSVDGAYYHFEGKYQTIKDAFYVTAAIATPKVGVGNIQPMVRYQLGSGDGPKAWTVDAAVAYLIMGPALRAMVNFEHTDLGNESVGNVLQFGAQGIFF